MIGVVGGFGASIKQPGHAHHNGMQLVRPEEMNGGMSDRLTTVVNTWEKAVTAKVILIHQMIWKIRLQCDV